MNKNMVGRAIGYEPRSFTVSTLRLRKCIKCSWSNVGSGGVVGFPVMVKKQNHCCCEPNGLGCQRKQWLNSNLRIVKSKALRPYFKESGHRCDRKEPPQRYIRSGRTRKMIRSRAESGRCLRYLKSPTIEIKKQANTMIGVEARPSKGKIISRSIRCRKRRYPCRAKNLIDKPLVSASAWVLKVIEKSSSRARQSNRVSRNHEGEFVAESNIVKLHRYLRSDSRNDIARMESCNTVIDSD